MSLPTLTALALGLVLLPLRAETFRYDTRHSQILASTSHNGFSQPVARLRIRAGWLRFDPDDWPNAATRLEVDLASIDLGDSAWNETLRGRAWLDVTRAPIAIFESTRVAAIDANRARVAGTLQFRGITRPIELEVTMNRIGTTIFGMHKVVGFSAHGSFERRDFGLRAHPRSVGRTIVLRLEIEAIAEPQRATEDPTP